MALEKYPKQHPSTAQIMRRFVPFLAKYDLHELIHQLKLPIVLKEIKERYVSKGTFRILRSVVRRWLDWYIKKIGLKSNLLYLLVPPSMTRNRRPHGKLLNFSAAATLISVLLNPSYDYIKDNNLLEFRCRRICLIMLSTGARISSTLCLKRDALRRDKHGKVWLHFHHVKNGDPFDTYVDNELQKWVEELQQVAPKKKLFIPKDLNTVVLSGDGLEEFRLFANEPDCSFLTTKAVSTWLHKLQKRLWGEHNPNGESFTPHDLRRLQATYLIMAGFNEEVVKAKLAQRDINSQIPYTATADPRDIRDYGDLLNNEDIYADLSSEPGQNGVPLDLVTQQLKSLNPSSNVIDNLIRQIDRLYQEFQQHQLGAGNGVFSILTPVASGNPLMTHNCLAPARYHCENSPRNCLGCGYYHPDEESLGAHKALVLREMARILYFEAMEKREKQTGMRIMIIENIRKSKREIAAIFPETFGRGFSLSAPEQKQLEEQLWKFAKQWYTRYKTDKELIFTQAEALNILGLK